MHIKVQTFSPLFCLCTMDGVRAGLREVIGIHMDQDPTLCKPADWERLRARLIAVCPGFRTDEIFHDVGPIIYNILLCERAIEKKEVEKKKAQD